MFKEKCFSFYIQGELNNHINHLKKKNKSLGYFYCLWKNKLPSLESWKRYIQNHCTNNTFLQWILSIINVNYHWHLAETQHFKKKARKLFKNTVSFFLKPMHKCSSVYFFWNILNMQWNERDMLSSIFNMKDA